MTNSNQDDNESQPIPEVEDPITNPGKREEVAEPSADETSSVEQQDPLSSSNTHWLLIAGAVVLLAALFVFMSGGPDEGGAQNTDQTANNDQSQETGARTDDSSNQTGGEGGESSEGGEGGLPVAQDDSGSTNSEGAANEGGVLDSINLETDIPVSSNEELIEEVTDILVLSNQLGPDDVLSISTEGEINGNRIIRMQQTHLGIPVFGAEVVAVENNGSVFNISGSTGNDIEISIEPELSFEEALEAANQNLAISVSPRPQIDAAQLLIIEVDDSYYLAWYSVVLIEGREEQVFLDAQDGSVLMRLPVNIEEA